ncbi:MAG: translation initiation factor IF-3, partial [Bifidobacterium bifidum]|nr:translation initiation factor IF-3 [Bifidobacterium bifidum]
CLAPRLAAKQEARSQAAAASAAAIDDQDKTSETK